MTSRVKIEEKKKKTADQRVNPTVQIKILIKVFKVKILLRKKSLLRGEISSRLIPVDIHRGRTRV